MRMCLVPIVFALSAPAWAQNAVVRADVSGVDVTELTVSGRGGVQTMVVHQALSILDDVTRQCYTQAQATAPKLAGNIAIRFKLDAKGTASNVAVTGMTGVNACLITAIKAARFAGPAKGPIEIREKVHLWSSPREAGVLGTLAPSGGAFASLTGTGDISSGFDDPSIYGGLLGEDTGAGFGRAGVGPGTGGPGNVPSIAIGQPEVEGSLDKAIIRRYIKRSMQKLQYCYEKQLLASPDLAGKVTASFTIGSDGLVRDSTATGLDSPEVNTCIADAIKIIEFPKPKSGEVTVRYPLVLRPGKKKP